MRTLTPQTERLIQYAAHSKLLDLEAMCNGERSRVWDASFPLKEFDEVAGFTHAVISESTRFDWRQTAPWQSLLQTLTLMELTIFGNLSVGVVDEVEVAMPLLESTDGGAFRWATEDVSLRTLRIKFVKMSRAKDDHRFDIFSLREGSMEYLFSIVPLFDPAGGTSTVTIDKPVSLKLIEYLDTMKKEAVTAQQEYLEEGIIEESDDEDMLDRNALSKYKAAAELVFNIETISKKLGKENATVLFNNKDYLLLKAIDRYIVEQISKSKIRQESFPHMFANKFPLMGNVKAVVTELTKELDTAGEVYGRVA